MHGGLCVDGLWRCGESRYAGVVGLLTLLLLPLLVRKLPDHPSDPQWCWWRECGLALLVGGAMAVLCSVVLANEYMPSGNHTTSDFAEYCSAVITRASGELSAYSQNRSLLAALPSALLLPHLGLIDAMTLPGGIAVGAMASGLYWWGRAIHGRLAGLVSAMAVGAFIPLTMMSRFLSFYPEITAVFVLAAGLSAVAVRVRTPLALAIGSLSSALCLLVDLRGLLFAIPFFGLLMGSAVMGPRRQWPSRLLIPVTAIGLAWWLAPTAYIPNHHAPLERQVSIHQRLVDRSLDVPPELLALPQTQYVWGESPIHQIPSSIWNLQQQMALAPISLQDSDETRSNYSRFLAPWHVPLGILGGLGGLGLLSRRRHAWRVIAALVTCAPFVASLRGAVSTQQAVLRFVSSGEPWMALALGVGFASLVQGAPRQGQTPRTSMRTWCAAALFVVMLLGWVPSFVSHRAAWRQELPRGDHTPLRLLDVTRQGRHGQPARCAQQLHDEQAAGRAIEGRLYGGMQLSP